MELSPSMSPSLVAPVRAQQMLPPRRPSGASTEHRPRLPALVAGLLILFPFLNPSGGGCGEGEDHCCSQNLLGQVQPLAPIVILNPP